MTKEGAEINPIAPFAYGGLAILPKHYWERRDVSATTTEPLLGSGSYQLEEYTLEQVAFFKRYDDYWGKDIPVMKGRYNFDIIKWDYYRDEQIIVEAHKAGVLDFREETVSKNWAIKYDFPEVYAGLFKKELIYIKRTWGMWWPAFWNVRIERFQDVRVREAFFLLYDFPWINRVILHGFYDYGNSYFYNSDMAWQGLPSAHELELLEPLRGQVPPRVFTHEFKAPPSTGYGTNLETFKRAIDLFKQAGWVLKEGELRHHETDERFKIDFVFVSAMLLRAKTPFMKRL